MPVSPYRKQNLEIAKSYAVMPPHSHSPDDELPAAVLQILCPDGKMTPSVCTQIMNFTRKEALVKEKCDFIAGIPMKGEITSLNASVAGGVLAYEILRQRMHKA